MEAIKWSYFQFRKQYGYPIYMRFKQEDAIPKFLHLLAEMGFQELSDSEAKKIALDKIHTKLLTVQYASSRLHQQLNGSDLLDKYGPESLSLQATIPVYTYRKVGIMTLPIHKTFWDLALHSDISQTDQMVGLRIILVRFLSQALAEFGVLSYWGTIKDETVIIMKQLQSFGEAVFIDNEKKIIFSNGGEMKFNSNLKLLRKDKEYRNSGHLSREEVISFMSVSTCLLSFYGITPSMKRAIMELSSIISAKHYVSEGLINL
jgi:hypothetical protein